MADGRVLVYDQEGNSWQIEPDLTTDVATYAKSLLAGGASATAKLADGHFVVIPAHAIIRVEVMTAAAIEASFDSRSASRLAEDLEG